MLSSTFLKGSITNHPVLNRFSFYVPYHAAVTALSYYTTSYYLSHRVSRLDIGYSFAYGLVCGSLRKVGIQAIEYKLNPEGAQYSTQEKIIFLAFYILIEFSISHYAISLIKSSHYFSNSINDLSFHSVSFAITELFNLVLINLNKQ